MLIEIRTEKQKNDAEEVSDVTVIGVYDPENGVRETYYAHQQNRLEQQIGEVETSQLAAQAGWE